MRPYSDLLYTLDNVTCFVKQTTDDIDALTDALTTDTPIPDSERSAYLLGWFDALRYVLEFTNDPHTNVTPTSNGLHARPFLWTPVNGVYKDGDRTQIHKITVEAYNKTTIHPDCTTGWTTYIRGWRDATNYSTHARETDYPWTLV